MNHSISGCTDLSQRYVMMLLIGQAGWSTRFPVADSQRSCVRQRKSNDFWQPPFLKPSSCNTTRVSSIQDTPPQQHSSSQLVECLSVGGGAAWCWVLRSCSKGFDATKVTAAFFSGVGLGLEAYLARSRANPSQPRSLPSLPGCANSSHKWVAISHLIDWNDSVDDSVDDLGMDRNQRPWSWRFFWCNH